MVIDDLVEIAAKERASRKKYVIRCCMAAGCMSSDSKGVKEALDKAVKEAGLEDQVEVRGVGCMKLCCQGPLVQVDSHGEGATVEVNAVVAVIDDSGAPASAPAPQSSEAANVPAASAAPAPARSARKRTGRASTGSSRPWSTPAFAVGKHAASAGQTSISNAG